MKMDMTTLAERLGRIKQLTDRYLEVSRRSREARDLARSIHREVEIARAELKPFTNEEVTKNQPTIRM
jgi:hypothetical protein